MAGAELARGSFKSVQALANTGYVAAELLAADIREREMRDVLREAELQLRLRCQGLRDKLQALRTGGTYRGGGRNIVKTLGFDVGTGRLVMKHGGHSLSALVGGLWHISEVRSFPQTRRGPLVRLMASVARQVLEALVFVQRMNIVHSDIKLANIVMGRGGKVTLIDWGASTNAGEAWVAGTPEYLSRQRSLNLRTRTLSASEDLYALGCTLIYMACGRDTVALDRGKLVLRDLGHDDLTDFVDKCIAAEDTPALGFSSADEALTHAFPQSANPAHERVFIQAYARQFLRESRPALAAYYNPGPGAAAASVGAAASAASAGAAGAGAPGMEPGAPPRPPAATTFTDFRARFPALVPALLEVSRLAVEAERLRSEVRDAAVAGGAAAGAAPPPAGPGADADAND